MQLENRAAPGPMRCSPGIGFTDGSGDQGPPEPLPFSALSSEGDAERKEMVQKNPAVKAQEFHRRIILPISNEIAAVLKDHSPFFFLDRLGAAFSAAAAE